MQFIAAAAGNRGVPGTGVGTVTVTVLVDGSCDTEFSPHALVSPAEIQVAWTLVLPTTAYETKLLENGLVVFTGSDATTAPTTYARTLEGVVSAEQAHQESYGQQHMHMQYEVQLMRKADKTIVSTKTVDFDLLVGTCTP